MAQHGEPTVPLPVPLRSANGERSAAAEPQASRKRTSSMLNHASRSRTWPGKVRERRATARRARKRARTSLVLKSTICGLEDDERASRRSRAPLDSPSMAQPGRGRGRESEGPAGGRVRATADHRWHAPSPTDSGALGTARGRRTWSPAGATCPAREMVDLVLDSSIRNWVLIPIFLIMIFMGIARQNVTALMRSATKTDFAVLKHKCARFRPTRATIAGLAGDTTHERALARPGWSGGGIPDANAGAGTP